MGSWTSKNEWHAGTGIARLAFQITRSRVGWLHNDLPCTIAEALGIVADENEGTRARVVTVAAAALATVRSLEPLDDEQLEGLREEAGAAGDLKQVALCDRALAGDAEAREECSRVVDRDLANTDEQKVGPGVDPAALAKLELELEEALAGAPELFGGGPKQPEA